MKLVSLSLLVFVGVAVPCRGDYGDSKELKIDFTNAADATKMATWSDPTKITVSKDGLGWDGDRTSCIDGWIETKPIALGLSWEPPYVLTVRFTVQPPARAITLDDGDAYTPDAGDVYLRYSPDRVNWSSWQALDRGQPQTPEERKLQARYYSGYTRVAYRDRSKYTDLLWDHSRLDVPWKGDEEAAVKWILSRDPEFLKKHMPFIGYVAFLYEPFFYGGQRIKSLKAEISYSLGGKNYPPKDSPLMKNRDTAWRFEGK